MDAWQWMPAAMDHRKPRPLLECVLPSGEGSPSKPPRSASATPTQVVRYAALRCLKMEPDEAQHATSLPDHQQRLVEQMLPNSRDVGWARKRKKGQSTVTALDGDRSLALDPSGIGIFDWVVGLATADARDLFAILRRNPADLSFPVEELQEVKFWRRISTGLAPGYFLKLRFGEGKRLSPSAALRLMELEPLVVVAKERDRDLGPLPDVMLRHTPQNDRMDCRSTSLLKIACLIRTKSPDLLSVTKGNDEQGTDSASACIANATQKEESINA